MFSEPTRGWLPDHLSSHTTEVLNFVLWSKLQITVLFVGIGETKAATNPQLR